MRALFGVLLSWWLVLPQFWAAAYNNTGLTDLVEWDKYSLVVNKQRVFAFSGEFHYQRLPVPTLWLDVFQKFKANGFNAASIYFFWSYHSYAKDKFDFETETKNVQQLLDYAKQAGIYIIARPGPYVNGETNNGGFALWISDGSGGKVRTGDETYHQAWLPFMKNISSILAKNQISNGGPVILVQVENELSETKYLANDTLVVYMEQLEKTLRDSGIVVPFFHNEKGMRAESWSPVYKNVGGAVDIYGLDSYPGGLNCTNPDAGFTTVRTYYQWFQQYAWTTPQLMPEFAIGAGFQNWGSAWYESCQSGLSPEYPDVYYKSLVGQRTTLIGLYMGYGGTNWGHLGAPVVYTSYDVTAPLKETREVRDKLKQIKLLGLFTRVSQDLLQTDMESNGTGNAVSSKDIFSWVLRNPVNNASFSVVEHDSTPSRATTTFSVDLKTSAGAITVPNVQLNGRQSRILVTDYKVGDYSLLYSSAEILTFGLLPNPVLVFYMTPGQIGEFAVASAPANLSFKSYGANAGFAGNKAANETFTRYTYTQPSGSAVIQFSNGIIAYLLDKPTAYNFFAPPLVSDPDVKPNEHIFVIGPYLVRNASISGGTVNIIGDNDKSGNIEVFVGDSSVSNVVWNGKEISTTVTAYGALVGTIDGTENRTVTLSSLEDLQWKTADSLPEKNTSYDDSKWTVADKTTTLAPQKPLTLPVLYSSDYGFHAGIKIYRGRFDGKTATKLNITAQGGQSAGWSAWVNGQFVGSAPGKAGDNTPSALLDLTKAPLVDTGNVLTVVTDYLGHDETSMGPNGPYNPRGILGASLMAGTTQLNFSSWKLQGMAGGDAAYIDPIRGPMNEGGLFGERRGWHLPGFDAGNWTTGSPLAGFSGAEIKWFVTDFDLDIDADLDVPLAIQFAALNSTQARIQLFVNGWQYGKFVPHIGPQTEFPVPPGIINTRGKNRLALSAWAQSESGFKLSSLKLITYGSYQTGFQVPVTGESLQPVWTSDRLNNT